MKLWGGNYSGDPDKAFWEFNRSFPFDRRLLAEEVAASRAYARALGRCGALPAKDAKALDEGLAQVLTRATSEPSYQEIDVEDVHSFVETRLGEIIGDLAGQGHLGRSRNEQAVTALRLWIRGAIDALSKGRRGPRRRARRPGPGGSGRRHAGLHAHARGRADRLRPSRGGPRVGPRTRSRAATRRPTARERPPPRLGRPRGNRAPPRSRGAGPRPRASRRSPRTPSTP